MTETVKPAGLRAARVAENEERIVRAAHELFARDGYQATTLTAVADAAHAGRAATRDAVRMFWTRAHDDGLLPTGCDLTWLADTTSMLAHAETYLLMRETLQVTPKQYQGWLATTWHRMALAASQS